MITKKEHDKLKSESDPEPTSDNQFEPIPENIKVENPPESEMIVEEIKITENTPSVIQPNGKPKFNKGLFIALGVTIVIGGALAGGILYSRKATNNQDIHSNAIETPTPTPSPEVNEITPTPTQEEIDLSEYTIQIQNGSGTAGQAGAVDEILQAEGFNQADTANADSYDYEKTEINLKENTPKAVYDTIERALNSDYQVIKGGALNKDSKFDIVVIVGKKI